MAQRCKALSARTGQQCRRWSIEGGSVCIMHGGNAPQVKEAAKRRLLDLVDPALKALWDILVSPVSSDSDKIAAAKTVLDRNRDTAPIRSNQITGPQGGPLELEVGPVGSALSRILKDPEAAKALETVAKRSKELPTPTEPVSTNNGHAPSAAEAIVEGEEVSPGS